MIKKAIIKAKLTDDQTWGYAKQESDLHAQLSNHNNVVRLYDHKETDDAYVMYMEYCDKGGQIADKILEVSLIRKINTAKLRLNLISNMANNL